MSLSTLLEAAKYLDFLDSSTSSKNKNNNDTQQQNNININASTSSSSSINIRQFNHHQLLQQQQQQQNDNSGRSTIRKKSPRRPRASSKKVGLNYQQQLQNNIDGNSDMIMAMSLPSSVRLASSAGLPIPMPGNNNNNLNYGPYSSSKSPPATGLSCSYTAGSPLSSPTSTALLSSKTSGITSNISSAASSLSSSDSSSSCGEILMSDLDFVQCATSLSSTCSIPVAKNNRQQQLSHINSNAELLTNLQQLNNNTNNPLTHHNYQQQKPYDASTTTYYRAGPTGSMPQPITGGNDKRAAARRKNSKTSGVNNMALATDQLIASTSVPLDGTLHGHAGRVYHATSPGQVKFAADHGQAVSVNNRGSGSAIDIHGASTSTYMSVPNSCFGTMVGPGNILGQTTARSPTGSLIMARVQPMILNSLAPPAHQSIMAFQQATAPSPTSTSSSYSRHRELHKTLEKNRRAHLRHCFELLKDELPGSECVDRKTSHINIIRSAIRCVLSLIDEGARLDTELQRQMEIKSKLTNKLANLKDNNNLSSNQQPVAEQQLSFLLSRSKID